jgi:hypothetical protein
MARQLLMARGRPNPRDAFDASSGTRARAALLGLALLAAPLACGSDPDAGDDDPAADQNEPPRSSDVAPRPATTAADPSPSNEDDDAMPANPSAAEREDAPDDPPAAPGASAGSSSGLPPAPATAFASCTRRDGSYGTNCDYVYVTMTQTSPERCVQLTIDNCGDSYTSQGLPVDTPLSWKLSSASIGSSPDECELGVFNPESARAAHRHRPRRHAPALEQRRRYVEHRRGDG